MFDRNFTTNRVTVVAVAFFLVMSVDASVADDSYGAPPPKLNVYLDKLVSSYPDWIASYDEENLIFKTGTKFPISDHKTMKSFPELIEHPDIDDMFYVPYPAGTVPKQPSENFDPGRVRYAPLFLAMYGDCRKDEVVSKLRTVDWLPAHDGGRVTITMVNGIDKALAAVSRELDELPADFIKFLKPTAGTYNCRTVAGSNIG